MHNHTTDSLTSRFRVNISRKVRVIFVATIERNNLNLARKNFVTLPSQTSGFYYWDLM